MSARNYDMNGFFEIADNPISKVGVFDYSGAQVGAPADQATKIFRVYRPAEELMDEEAMASFRLAPLIDDHTMLGEGHTPAEQKGIHGVIGENIRFAGDKLLANIKVFSKSLAEKIKKGKTELSLGYRCVYDFTPGSYNGQAYDVVQRKLRGNHIALVGEGRMGPDVAVLDHMVFTVDAMEKNPVSDKIEKLKAGLAALVDMLNAPEEGAAPAGDVNPVAAEPTPAATPVAASGDKAADEETPAGAEEAADKSGEEAPASMDAALAEIASLRGRLAAVEGKPAMDEKSMVQAIAAKNSLADRLAKHVGTFDHAAMTTAEVAAYGINKLGIKNVAKGQEAVALDAYLQAKAVPVATIAADSKPTALKASIAAYGATK